MGDLEGAVGERERLAVRDVEYQFARSTSHADQRGRRLQHLRPVVDARDTDETPAGTSPIDEGEWDVGTAVPPSSTVDRRVAGCQGLDRACAEVDPAETPVHPRKVAQVADERGSVVEGSVEQLLCALSACPRGQPTLPAGPSVVLAMRRTL
jgi:hypothetical protein